MLGIICVSVHWYAYISTHCTHVSTAIANSIHGFACVQVSFLVSTHKFMHKKSIHSLWSQSVFPVSVSSEQCTLTAFACVTACMYKKFIHSLSSHSVFIGYVSSGQCTLTAPTHVVSLCTPHVHKHCPTTFSYSLPQFLQFFISLCLQCASLRCQLDCITRPPDLHHR